MFVSLNFSLMCGASVRRVLLCSGKHYYALLKQRETLPEACKDTALIRVEELCPFPTEALQQELHKYSNAKGEALPLHDAL